MELALVRALLNAPDLERDCYPAVAAITGEAEFLSPLYAAVYRAIARLGAQGKSYHAAAVAWQMFGDGTLSVLPWVKVEGDPTTQREDGRAWLEAEADSQPTTAGFEDWAHEVHRCYRQRQLASKLTSVSERVMRQDADPEALLNDLAQELTRQTPPSRQGARFLREVVADDLPRFMDFLQHPNQLRGYAVGMPTTDFTLNGVEPGRVVLVAAGTSMGKSLTLLRFARGLVEKQPRLPVLYITLEMTQEQAKNRLIYARAGISETDLRRYASVTEAQEHALMGAMGWAGTQPILFDSGDADWLSLRSRIEQAVQRDGVGVVIIDHLDLVQHRKQADQGRHQQIAAIMSGIKNQAITLNVPFIVATQVNRQRNAREDQIPTLSDLRESGSKEEGADIVLILHRPAQVMTTANRRPAADDLIWHKMQCFVAKNRDGETPLIEWWVDMPTQRLEELAP